MFCIHIFINNYSLSRASSLFSFIHFLLKFDNKDLHFRRFLKSVGEELDPWFFFFPFTKILCTLILISLSLHPKKVTFTIVKSTCKMSGIVCGGFHTPCRYIVLHIHVHITGCWLLLTFQWGILSFFFLDSSNDERHCFESSFCMCMYPGPSLQIMALLICSTGDKDASRQLQISILFRGGSFILYQARFQVWSRMSIWMLFYYKLRAGPTDWIIGVWTIQVRVP